MPDPQLALLAAVIDSPVDAIIGTDLHGVVTSWNRGAEHIFGYTAEGMVGRRAVSVLAAPGHAKDFLTILEKVRRGERVEQFETVRGLKDGRLVSVSLSVMPVRDGTGAVIGTAKIARDITERRRAEQAHRAAEDQLRLITDSVPAYISYVGLDLRYRLVNHAYETWSASPARPWSDDTWATWWASERGRSSAPCSGVHSPGRASSTRTRR